MIRKMQEEDIDAVRKIDVIAFNAWWHQVSGSETLLPERSHVNMLACLMKDPEGCFISKEDERIVGFVFSRTWGQVGWFGPLAVLPNYQGQGIGKELIHASLEYLRQKPGRVIGLETMPESPYNLGLYLRLGFRACFPTLLMAKDLEPSSESRASLPRWSQAQEIQREGWLTDLQVATGKIAPGFDYSKEILSMESHVLGETIILLHKSRAIGMFTISLKSSRENGRDEVAATQVLAIHPEHADENAFSSLLNAGEALARSREKRKLVIPVNARYFWAVEYLLRAGFQVERMAVHMVLVGTGRGLVNDRIINCSRWAG